MAFRRLQYQFAADGSAFQSETRRMGDSVDDVGSKFTKVAGAVAGLTAGLGAALGVIVEMQQRIEALDIDAFERIRDAGLVGGDRAVAEAFQVTQQFTGVGPEQAFDAAEALTDAIKVKDRELIDPILADLGVNRQEFLAANPVDRVYQVIDAIAEQGGVHDDSVLQAASELGAGDIRDLATIGGLVAQVPSAHPRAIAGQLGRALPTLSADQASAASAIERAVQESAFEISQSDEGYGDPHNILQGATGLLGSIPLVGDIIEPAASFHRREVGRAVTGQELSTVSAIRDLVGQVIPDLSFDVSNPVGRFINEHAPPTIVIEDRSGSGIVTKPKDTSASDATQRTQITRSDPHRYQGD